jgi:hypothetical protein
MRGDLSISKIPGVLVMKDEKVCSVFWNIFWLLPK